MKLYQGKNSSPVFFILLIFISLLLISCENNSQARIEVPYTEAVNGVYFLADKDVYQTNEVYVTESGKTEPRKISVLPAAPFQLTVSDYKVSPDKKWVAYLITGGGTGNELYIIPTIGGNPIYLAGNKLPDFTTPDFAIRDFQWSQDGKYLAYSLSSNVNGGHLYTIAMSNLTRNHVSQDIPNEVINISTGVNDFTWSPDGKFLAYRGTYIALGKNIELFTVTADGTGRRKISNAMNSSLAAGILDFQWSPDSKQLGLLAAYDNQTDSELYIVTLATNTHVQITNKNIQGRVLTASFPRENEHYSQVIQWSLDSQYFAYIAQLNNSNIDLYVATPTGLTNKNITNFPAGNSLIKVNNYSWSPSNNIIAYTANETNSTKYELYTVNFDGNNKTIVSGNLIDGGFVSSFRWSPSGVQLAYDANQEVVSRFELYTVNTDGMNRVKVSGTPFYNNGGINWYNWSPDSRYLAFTPSFHDTQGIEVFTVNRSGVGLIQISGPMITNRNAGTFNWSQDSSYIVYIANQENENLWHAYRVPYNSNANQRISGSTHNGKIIKDLKLLD